MNLTHFITGLMVLFLITGGVLIARGVGPNDAREAQGDAGATAQNARTLDLRARGFTDVPEYVFSLSELGELYLSGNNLDGSLRAEVRHLQKLKILDLSNNKFTGVPAEIGSLSELEVLDLSGNQITGLPLELGNLSKLRLLDISDNPFSEADLAKIREKLSSTTVIKTE